MPLRVLLYCSSHFLDRILQVLVDYLDLYLAEFVLGDSASVMGAETASLFGVEAGAHVCLFIHL